MHPPLNPPRHPGQTCTSVTELCRRWLHPAGVSWLKSWCCASVYGAPATAVCVLMAPEGVVFVTSCDVAPISMRISLCQKWSDLPLSAITAGVCAANARPNPEPPPKKCKCQFWNERPEATPRGHRIGRNVQTFVSTIAHWSGPRNGSLCMQHPQPTPISWLS